MYVGRIVAVGMNQKGKCVGMYRVSSRSFPNRVTRFNGPFIAVVPKDGFVDDYKKSPYIAYNCIRLANENAVISNGSHTDPIAEKIKMGYPIRDALALSLLSLDYEKDNYNTPRIAGVITKKSNKALLGIIKKDALLVKEFNLTPGKLFYIATYEHDTPCFHYCDNDFDAVDSEEARNYVMSKGVFKDLENPVTSAAVIEASDGFELGSEG